jgi:hypothetical protein
LADEQAYIYNTPTYKNDVLIGSLKQTSNSAIDVSGGWFDAGDYLKFVQTASYVISMMGIAIRDYYPDGVDPLSVEMIAEFQFGIKWLMKMWDNSTQQLYTMVPKGRDNFKDIIKLV